MPSPSSKKAAFVPDAATTVNAGIEDASVPDATHHVKDLTLVALMTPMGDPFDINCIWGAPIIFWGLPSTAKSKMIKQAALEAGLPIAPMFPGQRQPEDFSGVLMQGPDGPKLECILGAVRWINEQRRGVIFLDEMGDATPVTQGALLGFIQDRICGDTPMVNGTRIILAANPPKWSTSGFSMRPTTANRMCHFQVKCPPVDSWISYMSRKGTQTTVNVTATEDLVRSKWNGAYSHAMALFTGYHRFRHGITLHQEPPPDSPQSGYGWASPRSWELATLLYATAICLDKDDMIKSLIVEGCVGEGCASDFFAWVRTANLPTPDYVLTHGWSPDPVRLDVASAVSDALMQYFINIRDRSEALQKAPGAWRVFNNYITQEMGDLIVPPARLLVGKNLSRKDSAELKQAADAPIRWMADNDILKYVDT